MQNVFPTAHIATELIFWHEFGALGNEKRGGF